MNIEELRAINMKNAASVRNEIEKKEEEEDRELEAKTYEETYPIEDSTEDCIGNLTFQRYGNKMKCILRYPSSDDTHQTDSIDFSVLDTETMNAVSKMVFDHCSINNAKFVRLSLMGILESVQGLPWYPKKGEQGNTQAATPTEQTEEYRELEAKNAVLGMVRSEICKHRGEELTVRVELCKTLLKQCGLDTKYAQNICKGVIKEEEKSDYPVEMKGSKLVLKTQAVANNLIKKHSIITFADVMYVYKDGYYQNGYVTVNKDIVEIAIDYEVKTNIVKESNDIIYYIKSLTSTDEYPFNKYQDAINVKNGVVVFNKELFYFELKEHSSDFKFAYKLPIVYNANAPDILYEKCFKAWTDEPDVLIQMIAQGIIQIFNNQPFKKGYLIQGDAHAGKSTFLNVIYTMFNGFYSNVPLQDLSKEFNIAPLENKVFNISDDLSDIPLSQTGTFKNLTGNYMHRIRNLHVQGRVGRVNAVHIYTCNVPPQTDKKSMLDSAFWERWQYVLFDNYFEIREDFTDDLYTEDNLSGIFNRVLDMICNIFKKGGLLYKQDMVHVRERWSLATDVIHQYLEENIDMGTNNVLYVDNKDLLENITRWALANDKDMRKVPNTINALTSALAKHNIECLEKRHDGTRSICYVINGMWSRDCRFQARTFKSETKQISLD